MRDLNLSGLNDSNRMLSESGDFVATFGGGCNDNSRVPEVGSQLGQSLESYDKQQKMLAGIVQASNQPCLFKSAEN